MLVRLVLGATAALLLVPVGSVDTGAASPNPSGKSEIQPAGHFEPIALTSHQQAPTKSTASKPFRSKDPVALRAAKIKAATQVQSAAAEPSTQATSSPLAVGLFNGLNKPGLAASDEGSGQTPPDSTGSIGPTRYVEFVNQMVGVYDRSTLALLSRQDLGSFVGAPAGVNTTDPQIQWDPQSNRWEYAEIGFATGNNFLLFGWTKTADPSDLAGGWCHYGISTGSNLQDYPKLGHDAHFLIVGSNVYDDSQSGFPFVTANIWAIPKPLATDSTCSSPVTATYFADATHLLKNADGTLAFTPVPANTADNAANDYIVAAHDVTLAPQSKVMVWHMESRPNAVLVADGDINVGTFAIPAGVPQPGTSFVVDSLDGRLTQAVARFDSGFGAEAIWTQQTVAGPGGRSVVRWYEFAPSLANPIVQQGQVSSATDFIWNAAISPSSTGRDAAIFYNRGSASVLALIAAQTRTSSTPLGQMDPGELILGNSTAADQENAFQGNCSPNPCRWGDYSGATPDPVNAGVVWGSNQLMGSVFLGYAQWTTQNFAVTTGAVPTPDFSLGASPSSQAIVAGGSTSYTVSATRTGGFTGDVTLSASGLPSGVSVSFSPDPVVNPGTTSMLSVTTGAGTAAGSYPITVTGTGGSLTRSTSATLVVNAGPDFSLSASPASRVVIQGAGTSYTVTIAASGGFSGNVALGSTGQPSGAGVAFSPNPVNTSGTSNLSVSTTATTATGTYTITVTGQSGSLARKATVTLVVQAPPPPDFAISLSPSSRTAIQGSGARYTATITPSNGFTGSVALSSSGLPSGAGASFNPATVNTSGSSSMSVTTSATTPTGTYTLTVTGASGSLSRSTSVTLVVQPPPDFSLTVTPSNQGVTHGSSISYGVTITPSGGFTGAVTLTAKGLPSGAAASFSANPTGTSSTMTVSTAAATPTGTYTLAINGVSGSLSHGTIVTMVVLQNLCDTPNLLTGASASPYPSGAGAITLTATGQCDGGTQYEFYYRDVNNAWHVIGGGYGAGSTAVWNADYQPGNYVLEVDIRPTGSSAGYITLSDLPFTLTGCGVPTLTPDLASPQAPGTTVHWTATATCSGTAQYEFYVHLPSGSWTIPQPWGSLNTFTWNSPSVGGAYIVEVDVRNAGASEDPYDNYTDVNYTLSTGPPHCNTPSVSTGSAASPYPSGAGAITLTATGQCDGGTQYEFYYRDVNNAWHVIGGGYGAGSTAVWNADYQPGNYVLEVDIRPTGSSAGYITLSDLPFTLTGCGVPTLTPDLASPQAPGTTVHWTATATCSGTAQYEFYVHLPSGSWTIPQPWGSLNTFTWNSPSVGGAYIVEVDVRNAGASEDPYDNYTDVNFNLG